EPAEAIREHAEALLVSRNLVEQQRRGAVDAAGELGGHPDLFLGTGAADDAQLAQILDPLQPMGEFPEGPGRPLGDALAHLPPPPRAGRGVQLAMGYTLGGLRGPRVAVF